MTLDDVLNSVDQVAERCSREIRQAVLRRDLYEAVAALGGEDTCRRVKDEITTIWHMRERIRDQEELRALRPRRATKPAARTAGGVPQPPRQARKEVA